MHHLRSLMSTATPTRPSAARERILDAAFRLFYARGIRAVGVDLDHRRVGRGQGDLLQALPGQGRARASPTSTRSTASGPASCTRPPRLPAPAPPTSWSASSTHSARRAGARATAAVPSSTPRPSRRRAPRCTTGPWRTRRPCSPGCASWPTQAGRRDPEALARSLTLLLDGGLASGALDADPEAPKVGPGLRRRPGVGCHRRLRLRHVRPPTPRRRELSLRDGPG